MPNYVISTDNNQPWKLKPAMGSQPGSILAFQDLHFNRYHHLVAAQKARPLSRGQPRGLSTYTVWRNASANILHTVSIRAGKWRPWLKRKSWNARMGPDRD